MIVVDSVVVDVVVAAAIVVVVVVVNDDDDDDNNICQVGSEGAGHFVKMVHNGIEYGDMQLICEAYHLMKQALDMSNDEISDVRLIVLFLRTSTLSISRTH